METLENTARIFSKKRTQCEKEDVSGRSEQHRNKVTGEERKVVKKRKDVVREA